MTGSANRFAGQRFVIKLGGEIILNEVGLDGLAREMTLLVDGGV